MDLSTRTIAWLAAGLALAAPAARAAGTASEEMKLLRTRMATESRKVLAEYDAHLRAHPDDAAAAIERCRFTWYAGDEVGALEELDEEESEAEAEDAEEEGQKEEEKDCASELSERFPKEPAVLLFRLSHTWGAEGIALAESIVADTSVRWTDRSKAELYADLAWKQWAVGKFPEAARAAAEATRLDDSLDLSLVIAKGLLLDGKRERAIEVLTAGLEHAKQTRVYHKAEMLLELGACDVAGPLFERPELAHQTLLHARVLECGGDTEAAREKYEKIDARHWQRKETLVRLLELDLRGDDPRRALDSYRAVRDLGWSADPFGRRRLSLAMRFPMAPWEPRDALGPAAFAGVTLFMLLVPGLVLVPIHYVGLLRRTFRGFTPDPSLRWKLRHVWMAGAAMLVIETVSMFLFVPGELEWIWVSESEVPLQHTLLALGRQGAVFFALTAVAVLAMLRRGDPGWLARNGGCHPAVTIAVAGVLALTFFFTLIVYLLVARGLGLWEVPATALFELDRLNTFRGIRTTYGAVPFLLLTAIVVPVYEEILFRWITLDGFARHLPFWIANLLHAAVFASLHMSGVLFLFFFGFAFVLGYARRFSGGLLIGILAHAGYNACVFLLWLLFAKM